MYIIVNAESKANPTKNRQIVNSKEVFVNAVAIPANAPTIFVPTSAGILP